MRETSRSLIFLVLILFAAAVPALGSESLVLTTNQLRPDLEVLFLAAEPAGAASRIPTFCRTPTPQCPKEEQISIEALAGSRGKIAEFEVGTGRTAGAWRIEGEGEPFPLYLERPRGSTISSLPLLDARQMDSALAETHTQWQGKSFWVNGNLPTNPFLASVSFTFAPVKSTLLRLGAAAPLHMERVTIAEVGINAVNGNLLLVLRPLGKARRLAIPVSAAQQPVPPADVSLFQKQSPRAQQAIRERRLFLGMTQDQARLSQGEPARIETTVDAKGTRVRWSYGSERSGLARHLEFKKGILIRYRETRAR